MKGTSKGKKGDWGYGPSDKGKGMKGKGDKGKREKGDSKGKGYKGVFTQPFDKGFFDKGYGKGKGKQADLVVAGCSHETVGSIIRGEYVKYGMNHGRAAYKRIGKPGVQEVQIYFWDQRDGPNMCGWWFGASIGGDMVWSFAPGDEPSPPRSGWRVPFEGEVDASLVVAPASTGFASAVEVGQDTHITVQGCAHPVVGAIVNGSFIRNAENHGKPVYKKTEQTKDGVDVLIYFWNDVQNPTFTGWWFGPEVGAEQVWAFNSSRLATAPLTGWKVPYDGPVDPGFHLTVDRKASSKQQAEVSRAAGLIRKVLAKLKHVKVETWESLEEELRMVMAKELPNCGAEYAKIKEDCERSLEQAKARVVQLKEAQEKAGPLMKELVSLLEAAEAAVETLKTQVDATTLQSSEEAVKACSQYIIEKGEPLTFGEGHLENMQRLQACKKAIRRGHGQKKHDECLAKMASYDSNKDGMLEKKDLKKYAQSEYKFALPDAVVDKIFKLMVPAGTKGVKSENFQRVKVQIGIAREYQIDLKRKKQREEREKELEVIKDRLKAHIQEELEPAATKVQDLGQELQEEAEKLKSEEKVVQLLSQLDELGEKCTACRSEIAEVLKKLKELKEEEKEVLHWLQGHLGLMEQKLKSLDANLAKISQNATRQRKEAEKKQQKELQDLQRRGLEIIQEYQKANEVLNADVFSEMSQGDQVDEKSFLSFFAKCEGNGEAEKPSEEDLRRLLAFWEAGATLDEERMAELLRRYMKVVTNVALTKDAGSESSAVRKLEVGEVVSLLGPPYTDEKIEVLRAKVQLLSDGTEGYVSLSGNAGTPYLQDGGGVFKVVKETLLTDDFELGTGAKDAPDRRLRVGELVEVKSCMRKDAKTGMKRIRCKALGDGALGWATVVGSSGTIFLEVK